MAIIKCFEDIESWQLARVICKKVFEVTNHGEFYKDFSLKDQIKRSSGSIMDNIAEGFDRDGNKEFLYFLSIAKGSAAEVMSQLYRALDYGYITKEKFEELYNDMNNIKNKIKNFMIYIRNSENKGVKFEKR